MGGSSPLEQVITTVSISKKSHTRTMNSWWTMRTCACKIEHAGGLACQRADERYERTEGRSRTKTCKRLPASCPTRQRLRGSAQLASPVGMLVLLACHQQPRICTRDISPDTPTSPDGIIESPRQEKTQSGDFTAT